MNTLGDFAVISVMGPHAGESTKQIFTRKKRDIEKVGKTFWLVRSPAVKPCMVQEMCSAARKRSQRVSCLFISPSSEGGAKDTDGASPATEYSVDGSTWLPLPKGLTPVTGRLDGRAAALVFDELTIIDKQAELDLWDYCCHGDGTAPIIFGQGRSTVCAIRKSSRACRGKMKSNIRVLVAKARLAAPFAVSVR
jgi:hypothetical protein